MRLPMLILAGILLVLSIVFGFVGCTTLTVEAGMVGYVYHKPILLSGGGFVEAVPGPARWGMSWRKYVTEIDVRQTTFDEQFQVLAADDLEIRFKAHAILSVKSDPTSVREVVEKYQGPQWFSHFFKEQFRAKVYDALREYDSRKAKENRIAIAASIESEMKQICAGTPFVVHSIMMGFVQYPLTVQQAVEAKLAAEQESERAVIQVRIADEMAKVKVAESKGIAEAQRIINESLTANYLRHEYVQALIECSRQPNTTIIYVPLGSDGLPLVQDVSVESAHQVEGVK